MFRHSHYYILSSQNAIGNECFVGEQPAESTVIELHHHCVPTATATAIPVDQSSSNRTDQNWIVKKLSDITVCEGEEEQIRYRRYCWHLFTIAIFYGLPAFQLILTYQQLLNTTGNQDICYYNYLCSHKLGEVR